MDYLLYRRGTSEDSEEKWQLFLQGKHQLTMLEALHDEHVLLGQDRTFQLVRDRFY